MVGGFKKTHFKDILNNIRKSNKRKIQFTVAINLVSSKDTNRERAMHSMSGNIEILIKNKTDALIEELFESFCSTYHIGLKTSMKWSDFIFDYINSLYYKCHKVNLICGGPYIDSPDWMKNKKATIDPINKYDDNCFQ